MNHEVTYAEVKGRNGLSPNQRGGAGINWIANENGDVIRAVLFTNKDQQRYTDYIDERIIKYEAEDQVYLKTLDKHGNKQLRKKPKPIRGCGLNAGLAGRNKTVNNAIKASNHRLPVTLIDRNPVSELWYERTTSAFVTDFVLEEYDDRGYFTIHHLFIPRDVLPLPYNAGNGALVVQQPNTLVQLLRTISYVARCWYYTFMSIDIA